MFSNFKALIRHGRNAKDMKDSSFTSPFYASDDSNAPHTKDFFTLSDSHHEVSQSIDVDQAQDSSSHSFQTGSAKQDCLPYLPHDSNYQDCHDHHDRHTQGTRNNEIHDSNFQQETSDKHIAHESQASIAQQHIQLNRYEDVAAQIYEKERADRIRSDKYPDLEKYKVLEKIGEGAFSNVYKAKYLVSGKMVAIKVLRKYQMDHTQKRAVLKEVAIMRQLNHPNIVRFIDVIESDSYYCIVQELVMGGEVFSAIVNFTYLSEDLSRHVIFQVAEAVRYLHEEVGVVHRDIKPENLLFQPIAFRPSQNPISKLRRSDDPKAKKDEGEFVPGIGGGTIGVVKLADFGLSKQIWEQNTKTPCGTVGYTAPEIVRDERYSKEVDMWAIGCVLYTLLCGFPPFYDERIEALTEKVARGKYTFLAPWWNEISDDAKYCVSRLLTVDPKKRYTINDLLNDPWLSKAKKPSSAIVEQAKREKAANPASFCAYQNEALYSPAALALREAFDVSAAVHRIGEEAALHKGHGVPEAVIEESEEYDQPTPPETVVRDINNNEGFALDLDSASILGRRKNNKVAAA